MVPQWSHNGRKIPYGFTQVSECSIFSGEGIHRGLSLDSRVRASGKAKMTMMMGMMFEHHNNIIVTRMDGGDDNDDDDDFDIFLKSYEKPQ
jgi:hypothetical protein